MKNDKRRIARLERKIDKLVKENTIDLEEMAERGKELVKIARILRGCKSFIAEATYEKLIEVVNEFEIRCT